MEPDTPFTQPAETSERNWKPLAIAAAAVVVVAGVVVFSLQTRTKPATVTAINASPDGYASSLPITSLEMSEATNLTGGKITYVDGKISNKGGRMVKGITVQVLFRNFAQEVTQNVTEPVMLIRTRDPYVDVIGVSASPLRPGDERDFRLIFDPVKEDWDGAFPQIRVVHVELE